MGTNLNGWRRIWLVVSALLLLFALAIASTVWPARNEDVLHDIAPTSCKMWLELPDGYVPSKWGDDCHALTSFMVSSKTHVSSVADYDKALSASRFQMASTGLGIWLAAVAALYLIGWAVGWVIAGFRQKAS